MSRNNRIVTNKDVFAGLKPKKRLLDDGDPLEEARLLPIEQVEPNPAQPRKRSNAEKDAELVADIGERGVLQPIIVRPRPDGADGKYQIIAGERRWRAASEAGLEEVPVIIKELDDQEAQLVSLVENLQRLDLDPYDEAEFFRKLSNDYNLSNRQIARMINRSHGYVNERMKLGTGGVTGLAGAEPPDENKAPAEPPVRERAAPVIKTWRYRPQNFQRLRSYIGETLEHLEELKDDRSRESLLQDIAGLREELEKLEKKLHVKTKR